MSTVSLLNPTVRRDRARRRDAVRSMYAQAAVETGPTKFQLRAVAEQLNRVRKVPSMTGRQKEFLFFRIVGRFYANVHAFAEKAEERRIEAELRRAREGREPWYRRVAKKAKALFGGE